MLIQEYLQNSAELFPDKPAIIQVGIEVFYKEENKEEKNLEKTLFFIINTFNYIKIKTKSELDNFLDLYKIFNKNFNVGL